MSCSGQSGCLCGACAGIAVETPAVESNPPGQPAISYRVGTWNSFKNSMLARLSSSKYPALSGLRTRDDDDFTIAFLDASAEMLDVLTFYQERLANESYLRTAQQPRSLTELSRLIGYWPAPGVGAQAYLAFTLKTTPGQTPDPSAAPITIPAGTQVQSVPGQGQLPQSFETSAAILAKPDWNALPVQSDALWTPQIGDPGVYLAGTATQLQPGDAVLIVGDERLKSPGDPHWDVRTVTAVEPDPLQLRTYVAFDRGLGYTTSYASVTPAQVNPRVYALRQKAAFFGAAAPDPNLFVNATTPTTSSFPNLIDTSSTPWQWYNYTVPGSPIYLDAPYPKIVSGTDSWVALTIPAQNAADALSAEMATLAGEIAKLKSDAALLAEVKLRAKEAKVELPDLALAIPLFPSGSPIRNRLEILGVSVAALSLPALEDVIVNLAVLVLKLEADLANLKQQWTTINLTSAPVVALYQAAAVAQVTQAAYSLTAKVAVVQLTPAAVDGATFTIRQTVVLAQSEELPVANQPLDYPLYGTLLDLEELRPDLGSAQVVVISGQRQKISVVADTLKFTPDDGSPAAILDVGAVLTITDPTTLAALNPVGGFADWTTASTLVDLSVQDAAGRTGKIAGALLSQIELAPSGASDPEVSEYALVAAVVNQEVPGQDSGIPHTQIQLTAPLANCYDRSTATVNANACLATQGQSVSEIMGSGAASATDQTFTLKQFPLTYTQAATPSGMASTLQVLVNGVAWTEVPSLYGQGPSQPVFATMNQSDGTTDVLFGDGTEGSVLPTGQTNVRANYRIGSGSAGNVAAGAVSMLMDRPLGVSGVTNPEPASGGVDPEAASAIRANAPTTVLTLGRAVSILDYQNFAETFAGVAKAYALWIPSGPGRGVFLTVAGASGTPYAAGDATIPNLTAALQSYGNPLIPIVVKDHNQATFGLKAAVRYDPGAVQATVEAAISQALAAAFSFAARTFGQGVSSDEVAAVIQAVPGVVAVNVTQLFPVAISAGGIPTWAAGLTIAGYRAWLSRRVRLIALNPNNPDQIQSALPVASSQAVPAPAEILVLDPDPSNVILGVMS